MPVRSRKMSIEVSVLKGRRPSRLSSPELRGLGSANDPAYGLRTLGRANGMPNSTARGHRLPTGRKNKMAQRGPDKRLNDGFFVPPSPELRLRGRVGDRGGTFDAEDPLARNRPTIGKSGVDSDSMRAFGQTGDIQSVMPEV
jgi:hypothetical protein